MTPFGKGFLAMLAFIAVMATDAVVLCAIYEGWAPVNVHCHGGGACSLAVDAR